MKKILFCVFLILFFISSNLLPVTACWAAPVPFEIFSEDGSRVFVFIPDENGMGNADAKVYEINGNERKLIYAAEGLNSFAYESNFHFSKDMTHFIRFFPAPGLPVFEAFAYGIKTREVLRSDFIEDYLSEEDYFTSIGPAYIVNWQVAGASLYDDTIAISTDEGNTFIFELITARFTAEDLFQPGETTIDMSEIKLEPVDISNEILSYEVVSGSAMTEDELIDILSRNLISENNDLPSYQEKSVIEFQTALGIAVMVICIVVVIGIVVAFFIRRNIST
ncbi:MAG: hypothetical protein FWE14_02025 [Lachnospiraceae bacterium]|nr:hypothetical protein [Lachnospiraceae bacterium]